MSRLVLSPNLADPDLVYEELVRLFAGLGDAEARRVGARLILILANHVGDAEIIHQAVELARR